MVVGEYPCCDGYLMIQVPDITPAYHRELSPHCGEAVWHKLSRLDPESWVESDFLKIFDVDYNTRSIKPKNQSM